MFSKRQACISSKYLRRASSVIINKFLSQTYFDPSWDQLLRAGLAKIDAHYLEDLLKQPCWLPGINHIFNAFSLPIDQVKYILVGESPYPRVQSANGYAFWDQNIDNLWSPTGLSKEANKATSFRNIIKTLLVAENLLDKNSTTQENIKNIDKTHLIKTNQEFFDKLLNQGFLLLNASLVLRQGKTNLKQDAKQWLLFFEEVMKQLLLKNINLKLLLFGKIALEVNKLLGQNLAKNSLVAEHPYNLSFINNQEVIDFFRPFGLLKIA